MSSPPTPHLAGVLRANRETQLLQQSRSGLYDTR